MADRRADLNGADRAVSDVLDEVNVRFHGLTAGWAYPEKFREWLRDRGYIVVSTGQSRLGPTVDDLEAELNNAEQALDEVRAELAEHVVPDGLPEVLSSVDNVARVCEVAGIPEVTSAAALAAIAEQPNDRTNPITRTWQDQSCRVSARRSMLLQVKVEAFAGGDWSGDGRQLRLTVLWSAIQAARGGEPS